MSLAERIEAALATRKPKFDQWVELLDKEDREALEAAATDSRIPTSTLVALIRDAGGAAGKDAVQAWRRARGYTG